MSLDLPILQESTSYSLRVSALENCQYSCPYCLPGTVKPFAHKPSWLTTLEYEALARCLANYPIDKIRFTGGEPLLRPNLIEIIAAFRKAMPRATLSLTTNAQHLHKKLDSLTQAGISRINVHIDSLNPTKYRKIMGKGDVTEILAFLRTIEDPALEIKLNVVLQKGVNDDELFDFIEFSRLSRIEVRFIELMNTGSAKGYVGDTFLEGAQAVSVIEKRYKIQSIGRVLPSDPATRFRVLDSNVIFGLIASDTQPFCDDCNRLRLGAQGELRGCLYQPSGIPLGSMLKSGASEQDLLSAVGLAVKKKRSFHPLVTGPKYPFSMAEIGG